MWSGWMNRFVATAAKADGERVDREVRLRDILAEEPEELVREDLRDDNARDDDAEPGASNPVRF
jgi:hypothetical protein